MKNTRFKWLLFDFDNTLVDFSAASKQSLWLTFEEHERACNERIYKTYQKINHQIWTDFEHGKISAERLRAKRFEDLFAALNENEMDAAYFGERYLGNLVVASNAYDGVLDLLETLKRKGYMMSIVTNGLKEVQRPRLAKMNMTHFFDSIIVSDEIGVKKPESAFFDYAYQSIASPPDKSDILMIGDSLHSDIRGGRDFGLKTCWNSHGKTNDTAVIPDYIISDVLGLKSVLGI